MTEEMTGLVRSLVDATIETSIAPEEVMKVFQNLYSQKITAENEIVIRRNPEELIVFNMKLEELLEKIGGKDIPAYVLEIVSIAYEMDTYKREQIVKELAKRDNITISMANNAFDYSISILVEALKEAGLYERREINSAHVLTILVSKIEM